VQDVPRRHAEIGRHDETEANAEQDEPEQASQCPLDMSVEVSVGEHRTTVASAPPDADMRSSGTLSA